MQHFFRPFFIENEICFINVKIISSEFTALKKNHVDLFFKRFMYVVYVKIVTSFNAT